MTVLVMIVMVIVIVVVIVMEMEWVRLQSSAMGGESMLCLVTELHLLHVDMWSHQLLLSIAGALVHPLT